MFVPLVDEGGATVVDGGVLAEGAGVTGCVAPGCVCAPTSTLAHKSRQKNETAMTARRAKI
jgi:hypothetical protein